MNFINKVSDNTGSTNAEDYQADAFVYQLDRSGETLRQRFRRYSRIHS